MADFYAEYMACLRSLGIDVRIWRTPVEFDDTTPFDEDHHHASYDTKSVENFHRILVSCDRVFKQFRARFIGKSSPVHLFWGSFDLAVSRFSGRPAPPRPGADRVTREAYSHEDSSCGFWPGDRRFKNAAFYAYSAPVPPGLEERSGAPGRGEAGTRNWAGNLFSPTMTRVPRRRQPNPSWNFAGRAHTRPEQKLAQWDRASLERGR